MPGPTVLRRARRAALASLLAAAFVVGGAGSALADHTHVRLLPSGQCVVLAEGAGEAYVELPAQVADPDVYPANRRHPLHVLVHLGRPGQGGEGNIFVMGSQEDLDNCEGYVNRP